MSIDIKKFSELVNIMASVGISQVAFDPNDDGGTLVRASNDEKTIIVFDTINESFSDKSIGISKLSALQSRLALFDIDKASISFTGSNDWVTDIVIKEGRKKVTYRCAIPKKINVPKKLADYTLPSGDPVRISSEMVSYLTTAVSAISLTGDKNKRKIGMSCEAGELSIAIEDGESDSFNTVEKAEGVEDFDRHQWNVKAFTKTLKHCSDLSEEKLASFYVIDEYGFCYFDSHPLSYVIPPEVS